MVSKTRPAALGVLPLLVPALAAQAPQSYDGWILVSTARTTEFPTPFNPFQGDGGLWLVHPFHPAEPVPVAGLDSDLTGAGMPGPIFAHGANCVLRLPDGKVLVGEAGFGVPIDLHVLTLQGASVVLDTKIACGAAGTTGEGGGIHQLAALPDGRILMALWGIVDGPLAGAHLGIAELATGTVSPVTVNGITDHVNALALDELGTTAYLGTTLGDVYSLSVPGGGTPVPIASLGATSVMNLARDNDGQLLAGCFYADLFKIDPATGSVTSLGLPSQVYNALAVERVTGNYAVAQHDDESAVPPSWWVALVDPAGVLTPPLSLPPAGGWGLMTGLDVDPNPEAFGPATPGLNTYTWSLAPSPGGLPVAGSSQFGLELVSSPGGAWGVLLVSKASLEPPMLVLGAWLNVDPGQLLLQPVDVPGVAGAHFIHLPIPPQPMLIGLELFLQTGHLEPGGVAASSGLKLTIL